MLQKVENNNKLEVFLFFLTLHHLVKNIIWPCNVINMRIFYMLGVKISVILVNNLSKFSTLTFSSTTMLMEPIQLQH
jgi:hypothetical protein